MTELFTLDYLADLPDVLRAEVYKAPTAEVALFRLTGHWAMAPYLDLFKRAGRPLSIAEVTVGMFRAHCKVVSKRYCATMLSGLTRRGHLVRVGRGVYALPGGVGNG